MTSQPRGQPSRRRPLRNITHRCANAGRETPLIKTIARNTIKSLPSPSPPPPPLPAHARRHTPGQRLRAGDVIIHQFSDLAHFDGAVRIFTRLPSIAGLAGVAPRLSGQDRDRLEIHLQYPKYSMCGGLSTGCTHGAIRPRHGCECTKSASCRRPSSMICASSAHPLRFAYCLQQRCVLLTHGPPAHTILVVCSAPRRL
ncbi:hypothetical protein F5B21DRAFT_166508 [Xylaria acuta]|nr:hypothetical protein F5B21DRAFT_166508 [Xylaria acuta]